MKLIFIVVFSLLTIITDAKEIVKGVAFIDINKNGIKDAKEKPMQGLLVSNGRDIVTTDKKGNYSIQKLDERFIFAIKPSGYQFQLDDGFQPEFYHKEGSTFNIPLYLSENEKKYTLILMGDPQVYKEDQINYLGEVATDELLGADYQFLIALGDIVGNSLPLLPTVKSTLGLAGKTNYYVLGNHDRDRGDFVEPSKEDNDSFEKTFGPDYYSFNWGDVHFLVLNDVLTIEKVGKKSDYKPGLHDEQVEFIKNDLANVPQDKLVVVCAHIPFALNGKKSATTRLMISLLNGHPKVFMATGHAHNQLQYYFDEDDGRENGEPIHQLVAGAICGNWWRGEYDMFGVPGSMMRDGTPQGYWFMYVDGTDYQLEYKASGFDKSKQMHIWVPQYFEMFDTLSTAEPGCRDIWINVYAGDEFTDVKLRIDNNAWETAQRKEEFDPYMVRLQKRQELGIIPTDGARALKTGARKSTHLWYGTIPVNLEKGAHMLEVTAKNNYGLNAKSNRVFWVK